MTPLSYLSGSGPKAYPVTALTWGLLIIAISVVVIVTVLVFSGILVRRMPRNAIVRDVPVERRGEGLGWLGFGVGVSTVVLVISAIWTMEVLAKINAPPSGAMPLAIEITGQQWWWKARYLNGDPSKILTTADEFHIPVGRPVRVKLIGADVIHSFWVPALTGKTETIPAKPMSPGSRPTSLGAIAANAPNIAASSTLIWPSSSSPNRQRTSRDGWTRS